MTVSRPEGRSTFGSGLSESSIAVNPREESKDLRLALKTRVLYHET